MSSIAFMGIMADKAKYKWRNRDKEELATKEKKNENEENKEENNPVKSQSDAK